jgi:hypothetical protein
VNRIPGRTKFIEVEETDDFFLKHTKKSDDELIVFCSARSGSVSYSSGIENFPSRLEKGYSSNDTIFIYPSQKVIENLYGNYEFDSNPISAGVEKIQKLGKEVKNIFKT